MDITLHDTAVGGFNFEVLRAMSTQGTGGVELGECLTTAARIHEGDFESWTRQWQYTADAVAQEAEQALRLLVRISRTPSRFTLPEKTSIPGVLRTGTGSPVKSASLKLEEPGVTTPSTGINSPGLTTISMPTSTWGCRSQTRHKAFRASNLAVVGYRTLVLKQKRGTARERSHFTSQFALRITRSA